MSDEERLELQMVSRYQDRLIEAKRMKMWAECDRLREEQAREALRQWREQEDKTPAILALAVALGMIFMALLAFSY